jgi:hypothetical protein
MKIINPATGEPIAEIEEDLRTSVRKKYERARAAQGDWAALPLKNARRHPRLPGAGRRDAGHAGTHADPRGRQADRQSRNELNGLLPRLDFFLAEAAGVLREEKVFADVKQNLEEHISRAARRRSQHLGMELSVFRRRQRVRAGAAGRQRRAL